MATYPTVELYVNSVWTDITSYVYYRDRIKISRGKSTEGAHSDTSTCRLTLDNRDGRFSPRNPTGTYYGQIGRNTPIRVLLDGGESYLDLPGAAGDRSSTPDAAALDITGDLDLRIEVSIVDWDASSPVELIGKYLLTGNQRSYRLMLDVDGYLSLIWSEDGSTFESETSTVSMVDQGVRRVALRATLDVNDGSGNHVVTFYTAPSIGGTWTQLGETITTAGTTSIFASTATLDIGDIIAMSLEEMVGFVHKASVRNGIAGTEVANPDFTIQTPGASSFVDAAGRTWTQAGNATIKNRKVRFTGEVSAWPVTSDISGSDVTVEVEAAGVLRRLGQGASPLDSALLRFIKSSPLIFECWPLTDGPLATFGEPLIGTKRMIPALTGSAINPRNLPMRWGQGQLAEWIEPVVQLPLSTDGTMRGYVGNEPSAATSWSVDFCIAGFQDFDITIADRGALTDANPRIGWTLEFDASADTIVVSVVAVGDTTSSSSLEATITDTGVFDEAAHHIRLTIDTSGGDTSWYVYIDGVLARSDIAVGYATQAVSFIRPGWFLASETSNYTSLGFITYLPIAGPEASEMYEAMTGYRGETAGARLARLCDEEDIPYQRLGSDATPTMGPQGRVQLVDILRECETADQGILYEPRDQIGIAYRDRTSLYNQDAGLALSYADHELSQTLAPVEDDQRTRNDVTVTQVYGSQYRATLDSGTLSTLAPPNGVGRYDESVTANLYDADDLADYANWRVHLGTVDEARYPSLSANLRHSTFTSSAAMMEDALTLDVGDRVTVDDVPSWWPPDQINQLSVGFTETLGFVERDIIVNCSPESPYQIAVVEGSHGRVDTAGCELAEALDTTETGVDVLTTGVYRWVDSATYATDFPFDIVVGGEVMTVTACTGTTLSQTFTVTRSVNGVVKSHSSGADVRLAHPSIVAL